MASVGLMCLGTHQHNIQRLYKIARHNHEITLLVSEDVRDAVEEYAGIRDRTNCVIKAEKESLWSYLKRAKKACDGEVDNIIHVGIYHFDPGGYLLYYMFNPDSRMFIYINNAHSWMGSLPQYSGDVRMSTILRENLNSVAKKMAISRFDVILAQLPTVKEYMQSQLGYKNSPVRTFAPIHTQESKGNEEGELITFVVPGSVQNSRRDYDTTLDVFEELFDEFPDKLQLSLLGKGKENEIIERCKSLEKEGYNINYYGADTWIPAEEFGDQMKNGDVVLLPQRYNKPQKLFNEIYGRSGGTGGVFEAIRHSKPIILPEHFPELDWISSSTMWYDDADSLFGIVRSIIEEPVKLNRLKREARINSKEFSIKKQREKFTNLLREFE